MTGANVKTAYLPAAAVAGCLIIAVIGYAAVGMMLKHINIPAPVKPPAAYIIKYAFYLVSVSTLPAFRILKKMSSKKTTPEETLIVMVKQSVIRAAISEIPALMGLVLLILTGFYRDFVLLTVFSLALEIISFPRLGAWKNALRVEFAVPPD